METNQTVRDVAEIVLKKFPEIKFDVLFKKTRKEEVRVARQIVQKLLYEIFEMTYPKIGELTNRDHVTIIHSRNRIQNRIDTELHFSNMYHGIENECKQYKKLGQMALLTFGIQDLINCMNDSRERPYLTNREIIKANFNIEL